MTRSLRLPDGCFRFPDDRPETVRLEHLKVALHGQGFATPAVREDLSAGYPPPAPGYFNIGLLHTAAGGREGHEPYAPCRPSALKAAGYDYWALGHVHQREILATHPFIVFPGNLQGRHIRESGPKGCYRVEVASPTDVRLVFEPLDVLRWETCPVEAGGAETPEVLVDRIGRSAAALTDRHGNLPLALRVVLSGASPALAAFRTDRGRWLNETRSALNGIGRGSIWLESIRFPPVREARTMAPSAPLEEVDRVMAAFLEDPGRLSELGRHLEALYRRLPGEWKARDRQADPADPEWLASCLREAVLILADRLKPEGDGP